MPNSIMAGLMTCKPPQPLPEDLLAFVESAQHGVIFVSFGSVLQASKMPEHKRKMMLNVFAGLKQKVIWKWEVPMPDAPENVLISSWLPQTSLLAHSNVVMFVTHGGAGSYQETICHRTPLVGVNISQSETSQTLAAISMDETMKWFMNSNVKLKKKYTLMDSSTQTLHGLIH